MTSDTPTAAEKLAQTAQNHLAKGEFKSAFAAFQQALDLDASNVSALHGLGIITAQTGDYDNAKQYLQRACDLQSDNAIIHSHLANVMLAQQYPEQAKLHYQQAIALAPNNPDPHNNLGNLYLKQQDWPNAEACYRHAIQLQPSHHDAHYNLGRLYIAQDKFVEAREHLVEANKSIERHPPTLTALGLALEKTHAVDDAIACYEESLSINPEQTQAQHHLGVCLLSQERYGEAKPHFEKMLALTPLDPTISYNLAVIATIEERYEDAVNYYKASLKLHPRSVAANTNLANLYLGFGDENSAIGYFQNVLRIDPNNEAVLFRLAAITQSGETHLSPKQYVQGLFDYYAPRYDKDLQENLHYQVPQMVLDFLETLPKNGGLRILDLGCGTGLCGMVARDFASNLVGIDLSEKMLAKARQKNCYDKLIEGDIVDVLAHLDERFDVVIAGDVLSYMGDLAPLFTAVKDVLAEDGKFAFTTEQAGDEVADYQLCKTTRFVHHSQYINFLLQQQNFAVIEQQSVTLREQHNQPVQGIWTVVSLINS